jgi:hypothetical protein
MQLEWLYFRSLKIDQRDITVVFVLNSSVFLLGRSSNPHLIKSRLGYMACFLNLSFDVLSVIF